MALLIVTPGRDTSVWKREIQRIDSAIPVLIWPDDHDAEAVVMAVCWNHPRGALQKYPNLKCISSLGAGVDHILSDTTIPDSVAITRIVDPHLSRMMAEYVTLAVLHHYRQWEQYEQHRANRVWQREPVPPIDNFHIGIMGMGEMGQAVARALTALQFPVLGWSRTHKRLPGLRSFAGQEELAEFLNLSNILVCLLPLTPQTRGILNRETFRRLPKGAYIINAARGEHLVEEDLLAFLENGHLSGACLDVFGEEPLPENHPFWQESRVMITPHIASITRVESVAAQIVENYRRLQNNQPLLNQVDRQRGY